MLCLHSIFQQLFSLYLFILEPLHLGRVEIFPTILNVGVDLTISSFTPESHYHE